ncbi:MAG: aconitate hydratase AcnA [Dehalococcoidia bacterium]|nr:aconitate hydratase AcnA [Dehalococcoidia bacterium]
MQTHRDPFGARATLDAGGQTVSFYRLEALEQAGLTNLDRLPFTVRILLENLLRHADGGLATPEQVAAMAAWGKEPASDREFPFLPGRVILQDFTGVPVVVSLASMRSALARLGGDPQWVNPLMPVDLVIDHSVQVDRFGTRDAYQYNVEKEYERNGERYALLRWAQQAFRNFRVVPPGAGIVHQVNLEYLAKVVSVNEHGVAYPDTLVGTDSHTTMINGLGVLGWGVGGIEAEAAMLGQPLYLLPPVVVGFRFRGQLREGVTATDLVLTVTQMLRRHGVVDKFVEYYGPGLSTLSLADRATIANMAPEYGATAGLFPVDEETLRYLRMTGRSDEHVQLVERYCKEQRLFRTDTQPEPEYSETLELDLSTVEPSIAGPRRPQDRLTLREVKRNFHAVFPQVDKQQTGSGNVAVAQKTAVDHGSVVIAAITSCTNTSNPSVMLGAGLLAKKAVERGLRVPSTVKTSLSPGSQVVMDYLDNAGLTPYLEQLGFALTGFGCMTCIGNSGPLPDDVAGEIQARDLVVAAVLSGNRNFEGRIHPLVRAAYLASPPLVVAYALAGTVDRDLTSEPVGLDPAGQPVMLADIWPSPREIADAIAAHVRPEDFRKRYSAIFAGDERWRSLPVPAGALMAWDPRSTYVREAPFFTNFSLDPPPLQNIIGARALVVVGDSVTTDHISPAGAIERTSPAGRYLIEQGVDPADFNSYGARRGNHEVMMRGTFANVRLRNALADGREGNFTTYLPTGEVMSIYEAAMRYAAAGIPLIVIGGKEYGSGSSRDWAAKGPALLGVRAVLAESFERIHRSNLVGMGVLPLQFLPGQNLSALGLTGRETFSIEGISDGIAPRETVTVRAVRADGSEVAFSAIARIDNQVEVEYYRHGGILPMVLRQMIRANQPERAPGAS